jgi:hypothetical protein
MAADSSGVKITNGITRRRSNGVSVQQHSVLPPRGITVEVESPAAGQGAQVGRVLVKLPSGQVIDASRTVVAAIAHALWEARGEHHLTNWLDAEAAFNLIIGARVGAGVPGTPRAGRSTPSAVRSPAANDDDRLPALASRPVRNRRF